MAKDCSVTMGKPFPSLGFWTPLKQTRVVVTYLSVTTSLPLSPKVQFIYLTDFTSCEPRFCNIKGV